MLTLHGNIAEASEVEEVREVLRILKGDIHF